MDRNKKTCLLLLLSVFLSTLLVYNIQASIVPMQDKRLIQVSTGEVFWMSHEEILELARKNHEQGRCGGFMDITEHPRHPRNDAEYLQPFWMVNNLTPSYPETVNLLLAEVSPKLLQESIEKLSAFNTRYYKSDTGVLAAQWIRDRFLEYGKNNSSITVELFQHAFKQPSVVAKILGKGPQSDELVILGAHEDSINLWGNLIDVEDKRAPGADDDASGVATLLETFRVIVESGFQPNRTLVFMTYAGEEVGLLGSLDIAKNYKGQNKKIAGVLQFDMTMFPGTSHKLTFINDHVDTKLTKFVEGLVDQYIKVPWTESSCGYACSDHASWTRYGYPSAFPFEAPFDEYNKKIHTSGDTLDNNLDILFGSYFAKLSLAFAVELAQAGL